MSCATLILWNSYPYSHRKTIDTKIIEIGVVLTLSSKILWAGPDPSKSMYFLWFLWKLTNFESQFLHNRWSDLSQILNLSLLWPKKNSGQSVHVHVHVRARKRNKRARHFSMLIVESDQLCCPQWVNGCLFGYTNYFSHCRIQHATCSM